MHKKNCFLLFTLMLSVTLSAQNLIRDPDFDKPLPHPEIHVTVGAANMSKQSIFTEDLSWNKCLKLEVLANAINQKTKKPFHFQRLFIGGDKGKGIKVKPNTTYNYSLDLKGNVTPQVFIMELSGRNKKKLNPFWIEHLSTTEWRTVKRKFKTGPNVTSVVICVDIVAYVARLMPKPGNYLLVDKVSLQESADVLKAFKDKKDISFVLTKINPATTPTIPLLPENIANPPEKISARAAANEFKAVPLALTNLTDNAEEYRIVINAFAPSLREENGLKSDSGHFPMDHLKLYRGIRVRDKNGKDFGLRFDPLTPMDISQTVVVQPKEAVPIWAIFNTYGVKPGKYKGVVRVIPLCQEAKIYKAHKDKIPKMHDIPFEFEVLPFELDKKYTMIQTFYTMAFGNRKVFQQLIDFGSYSAWITPWGFKMSFNPDGSVAGRDISLTVKSLRLYKKIAEDNGFGKELLIGLGLQAYKRFRDDLAKKQFKAGTPEWRRAWKNFIITADDVRKEAGLANENYFIEVWDEPKAEDIDEALAATKAIHEVRPDMQIFLTLAPWLIPAEKFEAFIPYVRYWCFWSVKYFRPEYEQLIKKLRARNKVLGLYTCETDMRQNLQKYYRGHAWTALAYDLDMANMYIYLDNLYYCKNWRQAPFGAFALMAGDTPLSTIRMECIRIGQNDLRYFKKLKEMFASTQIRDAKLRNEIAGFLQTTPQRLGVTEVSNPELAEDTREKIIDYILKLQSGK